jgi:hypothetical protein
MELLGLRYAFHLASQTGRCRFGVKLRSLAARPAGQFYHRKLTSISRTNPSDHAAASWLRRTASLAHSPSRPQPLASPVRFDKNPAGRRIGPGTRRIKNPVTSKFGPRQQFATHGRKRLRIDDCPCGSRVDSTAHKNNTATHRMVAGGASSADRLTESKRFGHSGSDISSIDGTIEGPWSNWANSSTSLSRRGGISDASRRRTSRSRSPISSQIARQWM